MRFILCVTKRIQKILFKMFLKNYGSTEKRLNNTYVGIALHTYGLDVSYVINDSLNTVLGYYYQDSDDTSEGTVGSGVKAGLDYKINDQLALTPNISYDNGFNTRFSLNLTYQFGTTSDTFSSLRSNNRDIRVYDPGNLIGLDTIGN